MDSMINIRIHFCFSIYIRSTNSSDYIEMQLILIYKFGLKKPNEKIFSERVALAPWIKKFGIFLLNLAKNNLLVSKL